MNYKMYGWGNDPFRVLPELKKRGYTAVTGGYREDVSKLCRELRLEYYVSSHGFSAPKSPYVCCDGEKLEKEICIHDSGMRAQKFASMQAFAASADVAGITLDFCRYPSMVGGAKHFFGCFCPTCMEKMQDNGLDAEKIRASVNALYEASIHGTLFSEDPAFLRQWLLWKETSITEYYTALRDIVKKEAPQIRFGAYVFAPSVAGLVGQNYAKLGEVSDFLSPMLYRHWRHEAGDACLDKEVDGVLAFIGENHSVRHAFAECGFDAFCFPDRTFLAETGMLVSHIVKETKLARNMTPKGKLAPIYLLEDPHIAHTVESVLRMCDEIDFFVYRDEHIDNVKVK